jgi:hypothetical protein
MRLIDKINIGLGGVMLAGMITASASLYSIINPIVEMAKNPAQATEEAKNQYVSQYPTKERILYTGFGAMGFSILALLPLSLYSGFEFNKSLKRIEESCRKIGVK